MELSKRFSISDLVAKADELIRARQAQYEGVEPIETPRNVHYYVKQGLLNPPEGRGPKTVYPEEALYRLVFIRILQAKTPFDLREIRHFMRDRDERQIRDIATGDEPFEVRAWPLGAQQMLAVSAMAAPSTDADAEQFGELSAKFAAMAQDFARTAADFATMAESYSRRNKV